MRSLLIAIPFVTIYLVCHTKNKNVTLQIHISEMTFNAEADCFEATLTLNNKARTLSVCDFDKADSKKAKILGNKLKDWLVNNLNTSKEYAATKLLKLKNENWLGENERPITQTVFIETIEFDGINAFAEGGFEIYFNDHDLFNGHIIIIDVNEDFGFDNAKIAG